MSAPAAQQPAAPSAPPTAAISKAATPAWSVATRLAVPLLLFCWLLRCWHLSFYDLRGDEVFGVSFAGQPLGQMLAALANGEPHPPLFYSLLRLWMPLAGDGAYALRWLSAAGAALAVATIYVAGRRLAGPNVGVAAGILMSLAPYQIWNAQDARMYTLATAFTSAAVYWSWRLLLTDRPEWRSAVAVVATLLLALYTHYYSIYVAVLLNGVAVAVLLTQWRRAGWVATRQRLAAWYAAQVAVSALYVPWLVYAWRTVTAYHGNAGSPSALDALRQCLTTFALGWDLPGQMSASLLPIYGLALLLGLFCAARLPRPWLSGLLLVFWLVVPIAAIWLASRTRPIFDVRYLIEASPPFYLLLALPAHCLGERAVWRSAVGAFALTVIVVPVVPALDATYFHPSDGRGHGFSALGGFLADHVTPDDVVVVNDLDPVVRYYAEHAGVTAPIVAAPSQRGLDPEALNAELSAVVRDRQRVWLVPDDARAWDVDQTVLAWLDRHAARVAQLTNGYDVVEYQTLTPASQANVTFGDAVTLTGFRLDPAHPQPGQSWRVILFWRAPAPVAADDTVSVQLLNTSGQLVAQQDSPPQSGRAATSSWQPFETIPDVRALALPATLPPGRYVLGVAVYPSGGGPRLAVPDTPSGLAPLTTVTIP